jgi:ABC-type phosphate transport system substrate-binding protein
MKPLGIAHPGRLAAGRLFVALLLALWLPRLTSGQQAQVVGATDGGPLAIVVNKSNPVDDLSMEELRKYFLLEHDHWPNGRKTTVLMLPAGTPERDLALRAVYRFTEGEFAQYFIKENFTGRIRSSPKELISALNVRKFVFNVPGAIGYLRAQEVDDTVKVIRVDGRAPNDPGYPLTLANLAPQ